LSAISNEVAVWFNRLRGAWRHLFIRFRVEEIFMKLSAHIRSLALVTACILVPSVGVSQNPLPQQGQNVGQRGSAKQPAVVATVNGEPISKPEFERVAQERVARARQSAAQAGQQLSPEQVSEVKSKALDVLIESRLVEAYAIENVDVPKSQLKQTVDKLEQQLAQQQMSLEGYLASQGQTIDSFKKRIEGSLAWQGLQQKELQPEKLQQFYKANQKAFPGDSFEAVQPQVAQAYVSSLWEQIVNEMEPKASIEKKNAPGSSPQQRRSAQPTGGSFPVPGNGQ
jgi:hypothetical protein